MAEERQTAEMAALGTARPPVVIKEMPECPVRTWRDFLRWVGPAVVLGSIATGGMEAMHAPKLGSDGFLVGVFWLYTLATLMTVIINREIARYTIATGESIFYGLSRMRPAKFWYWWWTVINTLCWIWPAWLVAAVVCIAYVFGGYWYYWGIAGYILLIILLGLAPKVYTVIEYLFYIVMLVTGIGALSLFLVIPTDILVKGAIGFIVPGNIFAILPLMAIAPFMPQSLGATINLWHSYYLREKGAGMGHYIGKLRGYTRRAEVVEAVGYMFDVKDKTQVERFRKWLSVDTRSQIIFMAFIGSILFTFLYATGAYSIFYVGGETLPVPMVPLAISIIMGRYFGPIVGLIYAFSIGLSLLDCQWSFTDAMCRVTAEAIKQELKPRISYRTLYFIFLVLISGIGILLLPIALPYILWLIVSAMLTFYMVVYEIQLVYLNNKILPREIRPHPIWSVALLLWAAFQFIVWAWWFSTLIKF